jgi:DNA repair protein RecN (Recombination protein N)
MLQSLSIRDFVIVSKLDLEFSSGFTVLTGETGAGKSILIDALSLALGARAEGGVTRVGCDKAEISAIFSIEYNTEAKQWLLQAEMENDGDELILRRVMFADGRSRAYINGLNVSVAQLKELGELLVDIYSQNAHHSLLKSATQRQVLDNFAGLSATATAVATLYKTWHQLHVQRVEAEKNASAYADELAELRDSSRELSQLVISPAEWDELQQEHLRLSNAASLMAGAESSRELLAEGELSALRLLTQVQHKLQNLSEYDASMLEATEALDSAIIQLEETDRFLNHYVQRTDLDPAALDAIESQLQNLHNAARKFRVKPEELAELLSQSQLRMAELELFVNDGALAKNEAAALLAYTQLAEQLSHGRQLAAAKLSTQISAEMQRLSLSGGKFEVALSATAPAVHGLEQVEFLVAGHAGVVARPLNKAASGGELSRISLAIRVVTAQKESIPTMIFDEVDVGIGGGVAEVVGQLLKQLGEQSAGDQPSQRQVLVITHLAQVAALGKHHLRVSKSLVGEQTLSTIEVLSADDRVEEIARMLGGIEITATTRQHAQEMLTS